jgi:hypothetical protein
MRDDALPGRRIALAAAAMAGVVALVIAAVAVLLHERHVPHGGVPVARPVPLPPGDPMLQTAPQDDLAAYRRAQSEALARADATHVPITTAMARLSAASGSSSPSEAANASAAEVRP